MGLSSGGWCRPSPLLSSPPELHVHCQSCSGESWLSIWQGLHPLPYLYYITLLLLLWRFYLRLAEVGNGTTPLPASHLQMSVTRGLSLLPPSIPTVTTPFSCEPNKPFLPYLFHRVFCPSNVQALLVGKCMFLQQAFFLSSLIVIWPFWLNLPCTKKPFLSGLVFPLNETICKLSNDS